MGSIKMLERQANLCVITANQLPLSTKADLVNLVMLYIGPLYDQVALLILCCLANTLKLEIRFASSVGNKFLTQRSCHLDTSGTM